MKQLLLRVPDDIHRRLAAQAADTGRSVNALATSILDTAIGNEPTDRRTRLRARAAALNLLAASDPVPPQTPAQRRATVDSTHGLGPILDAILDADRERL